MSIARRSPAPAPAAWPRSTRSATSSSGRAYGAVRHAAIMLGFAGSSATAIRRSVDGTRLSGHGQGPAGGEPRLPRQQQNQAPLAAEPAVPPLLGREREPLDPAAHQQRGAAPDRRSEEHTS